LGGSPQSIGSWFPKASYVPADLRDVTA